MDSKGEKIIIAKAREMGFEYTAQYIEKYGMEKLNPGFWRGFHRHTEEFYKMCVKEGHPYDYYVKYSGDEIF